MRRLIAGIVFVFSLAALAATSKTAVLDVQNMSCGLCPVTVRQALLKVPGVAEAKVDLDKRTATVTFDAGRTDTAALTKATTDAGFPSTARK
jgi:mercuric ion binding protein